MRIAGYVESGRGAEASRFVVALRGLAIRGEVEETSDGRYAIWIYSEDELEQARELFERYRAQPNAAEFEEAVRAGEMMERLEAARHRKLAVKGQLQGLSFKSASGGYVTCTLLALSMAVFFLTELTGIVRLKQLLLIGQYIAVPPAGWWSGLVEIRQGQLWRLVTPVLLHFGFLHIIFNMIWLYDLGLAIERRRGSLFLLLFVLAVAVPSNLAQYAFSGPHFGGMSGVVYGLLGYIWMQGRYAPREGFLLPPATIAIMVGWLLLGLVGIIPHMANMVHVVGLLIGVVWGGLAALVNRGN